MTIVFADAFNVAATTPLEEYPSVGSPDYVAIFGGNSLAIDPTQDGVYPESNSADFLYRVIDASAPTGDQEVTLIATVQGTGYTQVYVLARASGNNPLGSCYSLQRSGPTTWQLWRMNNGVWGAENSGIPLTSFTVAAINAPATVIVKLKVTGTNPVVVTATINGVEQTPYNDSHSNRLTTGTPGIGGWIEPGDSTPYGTLLFADDLSVPSTFGDTTPGTSSFPTTDDRAIVRSFALGEDGQVNGITLYFDGSSTEGSFHKALIYANEGGFPGALIAVSEEGYLPPGGTSLTLPISATLTGGSYFAGGVSNGFASRWTCDVNAGGFRKEATTYATPAAFGASPPTTTDGISVLIYYTPAGEPPPSGVIPKMRTPYERLPRGGDDVWDQAQASVILTDDVFDAVIQSGTGLVGVWNGSAWVQKPVKVWDGAAWTTKPLKRWNGASWV